MEPTPTNSDRDPYLWRKAKARVGFKMHLRTYFIINAGLWLIWAVSNFAVRSSGHSSDLFPWPIFPMLGWGIGVASHYFSVYWSGNERNMVEEEYKKLANQ
jgi:hypothetical protein